MLITKTTRIDATPERLWELLTDGEQMKHWMSSVVSDEPVSTGPVGVGYLSKMKIKEGSKIVEYDSEIASYEPTSHLGIILRGGSLGEGPMHVDYHLVPQETGTVLNYEARWKPHGFMLKLMSPLITMMANRNAAEEMSRLKEFAEGR